MNYIDFMKGGGIHIKKKNEGKFTESARRAGKSVQEHATDVLNDPNATRLQKRRAQFAKNAKKFKHDDGGIIHASNGASLQYFVNPNLKDKQEEVQKKDNTEQETTKSTPTETTDATTDWVNEYIQKYSGMSRQAIIQDPTTGTYSSTTIAHSGDPRGFRNNNWLNIRISNNNWQGKRTDNTDGAFEQFETPELGIRAAARNIRTYGQRGLQTVNGIISTWAPVSENNTAVYIQNVASRMGVDPNQTLDLNDTDTMVKLISAMTISENGRAGDESIIRRGVEMA